MTMIMTYWTARHYDYDYDMTIMTKKTNRHDHDYDIIVCKCCPVIYAPSLNSIKLNESNDIGDVCSLNTFFPLTPLIASSMLFKRLNLSLVLM